MKFYPRIEKVDMKVDIIVKSYFTLLSKMHMSLSSMFVCISLLNLP